jgi:hypothetical protein
MDAGQKEDAGSFYERRAQERRALQAEIRLLEESVRRSQGDVTEPLFKAELAKARTRLEVVEYVGD